MHQAQAGIQFHRMIAVIGAMATLLFLGCATVPSSPTTSSSPARRGWVRPAAHADNPSSITTSHTGNGSLWHENSSLTHLFINPKARRIGDIVTIRIVESSSATNKATTDTKRENDVTASLTNFLGAEKRFDSTSPFLNPFVGVSGGFASDFKGEGTTKRSGDLNAFMTAVVVDALPNGNLIIEGNREVRVNDENQVITLSGVVRPRDISAQNVIQSTYIADARISYSGTGIVNDRQRPGWLSRILDKVWPF